MNKEKVNQRKQQIKERQKRAKLRRNMLIGASALAAVLVVGYLIYNSFRPPIGEVVDVSMQIQQHLQEGSDLPAFKTNPPTGGVHYPSTFPAKFFESTELAGLPVHPEGYLVHNLEHGYVIIWYNCKNLDESNCGNLKSQIKDVMAKVNGVKVIAFPWENMDENTVLTSWNRIARVEKFSAGDALEFIRVNRNKSPEPSAS